MRRLLRRKIEVAGVSIAHVAEALGHDRTWLNKILKGRRRLSIDHVESVHQVLRQSPADLLIDCAYEVAADGSLIHGGLHRPEHLLRALLSTCEDDDWPGSENLERWRIRRVVGAQPNDRFEIDRRVQELDDLREHDARAALIESELWLRWLYDRSTNRRLDPSESIRVASALGVWASALRVRGRVRPAAHVLIEAFVLHGAARSSPTYADLLERAAFVAKDFGFLDPALELVQRSNALFTVSHLEARQARSILALGIIHLYLGQFELAEIAFQNCLTCPGSAPVQRAGALVNLIYVYERLARTDQASTALKVAEAMVEELPAAWRAVILSARSRELDRRGELAEAIRVLIEAIEIARERTAPCPQFLRFLDLADLLIRSDRTDELITHAAAHSRLLTELEDTPAARAVVIELFNTIRAGTTLSSRDIADASERFRHAMDYHPSPPSQPTGSTIG